MKGFPELKPDKKMKNKIAVFLLIAAAFLLSSCGGSNDPVKETGSDQTTVTVSEDVTAEPDDLPAVPDSTEFPVCERYKEKVTERSGIASFSGLRMKIEYDSRFYGYQSLINRDLTRYGESFQLRNCSGLPSEGQFAGADLNGDGYDEFLTYKDGYVTVTSLSMTEKKTAVYFPSRTTLFKPVDLGRFEVGEGLTLIGAGDLNADNYSDIVFTKDGFVVIYKGHTGGFTSEIIRFETEGKVCCGDYNGDGRTDIIVVNNGSANCFTYENGGLTECGACKVPVPEGIVSVFSGDMNCDGLADIIYLTEKDGDSYLLSYFGNGDGRFGSPEGEDNKNLYAEAKLSKNAGNIACADFTGTGIASFAGTFNTSVGTGVLFANGEPAYDYSIYGMRVNGEYRIYSGCRWSDANYENSDGDHVMLTTSKDGKTWKKYIEAPMFMLGCELGIDEWWSDNTLEPEVIYVDGKYHMYWQCSYTTPGGNYGDKIGYASSDDGVHWERKTDEPVIVCDDPEVGFNHEEVLYVPDDPDGKSYWMYTGHFRNGTWSGYVRIRSAVPDRFEYKDREGTDGFSQIGNQLAYFTDDDGRRIFVRITFSDAVEEDGQKYWRPTLYFSTDGLRFVSGNNCILAGVDVTDPRTENNRNMFFLGMITENGTGEIKRNEDGTYTIIYLATTCKTSVAPEIYDAEVGYGEMTFRLSGSGSAGTPVQNASVIDFNTEEGRAAGTFFGKGCKYQDDAGTDGIVVAYLENFSPDGSEATAEGEGGLFGNGIAVKFDSSADGEATVVATLICPDHVNGAADYRLYHSTNDGEYVKEELNEVQDHVFFDYTIKVNVKKGENTIKFVQGVNPWGRGECGNGWRVDIAKLAIVLP